MFVFANDIVIKLNLIYNDKTTYTETVKNNNNKLKMQLLYSVHMIEYMTILYQHRKCNGLYNMEL